jgi:FOG: Glucan-binding domain (YG repeat)
MKYKKVILTTVAVSSLFFAISNAVYASDQWKQTDAGWQYFDHSNQLQRSSWYQSEDRWYYLGADSIMLQNELALIDGHQYFFKGNGSMASLEWQQIETPNGEFWFYFGRDGRAFKRTGSRFKRVIDNKTYIFNEDGHMLTGWIDEDGNTVDENLDSQFMKGIYYCKEDGEMYVNSWFNYFDSFWYDEIGPNLVGTDYSNYSEFWFYFNRDGKKLKSDGSYIRQMNVDGKSYGFDENGVMKSWWSLTNKVTAEATSNDAKFYYGHIGGELLKNKWVWTWPSLEQDEDDYINQEASWWRADSDGRIYKDRIQMINGRRYAFDKIGRMQIGFVFANGYSEFVGQLAPETLTSQNFKDGIMWGFGATTDLYFFSINELNDGSMQTGLEVKIELDDGLFTFGFNNAGRAYGNRNEIERVNNAYYRSGLRLEADESIGYGVVVDENGISRVVDTKGRIIEGNRRVIRDLEGDWIIIINNEFKAYVDGAEERPRWWNDGTDEGYFHYDSSLPAGQRHGDFITNKDEISVSLGGGAFHHKEIYKHQ